MTTGGQRDEFTFPRGMILAGVLALCQPLAAADPTTAPPPTHSFTTNSRSAVVISESPGATVRFVPQDAPVRSMVDQGLKELTGFADVNQAWRSLVSTQDIVGLKVFSRPGATSGTRPTVVEAVVRGLMAAGVPARQIVIWDAHLADLRLAGFAALADQLGVRLAGSLESGWDESVAYETPLLGQLVYGDLEFGRSGPGVGRKSYASKLLTQDLTRLISIAPLLNNNQAGVSGHCWGLAMASMDNLLRFESSGSRLAEAVPEILALEKLNLRDRLVLAITDAMLCQYQGEERQLLHYSTVLDQLWFSTDPVALDVLAVHQVELQRRLSAIIAPPTPMDIFDNLALLELGVARTNRIDVRRPPTLTPPR